MTLEEKAQAELVSKMRLYSAKELSGEFMGCDKLVAVNQAETKYLEQMKEAEAVRFEAQRKMWAAE